MGRVNLIVKIYEKDIFGVRNNLLEHDIMKLQYLDFSKQY